MALKALFGSTLNQNLIGKFIIRRNLMKSIDFHAKAMGVKKAIEGSRSRHVSLQEENLAKHIMKFNSQTAPKWDEIKSSVLDEGRAITSINFDAKIISLCIAQKNIQAGKSFMNYIYDNKQEPNIATLGKYLRLFHVCYEDSNISKEDERIIIDICQELKRRCPLLDSVTAENIILGLSLTQKWHDCLEILETLEFLSKPSGQSYSAIARAAFHSNKEKIGWQIINQAIAEDRIINPSTYSAFLKMAARSQDTVSKIENLLEFFAANDILPCKKLTDELKLITQSYGYCGTYTTIETEYCKSCHGRFDDVSISKNEFQNLKSVFLNKCLLGKNLFNKSTPQELKSFKEFMSNAAPYDMVIDGLNVAYSAGVKVSAHIQAQMLRTVVDYFTNKSMRVLVLGRVHMKHWPKNCIGNIKEKADVFLTQNLSEDDPYLIYAAMASGMGTGFLSRDRMRGHSYLLMDQKIRRLFRKWQQLHQHSLIYVNFENRDVKIKNPNKILSTTQKYKTGWHIPYQEEYVALPPVSLEVPKNWLCIQKVS